MGTTFAKLVNPKIDEHCSLRMNQSADGFTFLSAFEEEDNNGLYFVDIYLPEEIVSKIFSFIPAKNLLNLTLVCKKWCNILKSEGFWLNRYNENHKRRGKKLPWYVYYCYFATDNFKNLIKNGNGENQFEHWRIVKNFGDEFKIEDPPVGADPLPSNVPDFNGHTGCFATSFYECIKVQEISFIPKNLMRFIMKEYMPHLYGSEWVAGRSDCGSQYRLSICGYYQKDSSNAQLLFTSSEYFTVEQFCGRKWEKVEIVIPKYPAHITDVIFEHEGKDTQFWKGHYGSKMAGGVLKFLFETIEPKGENPREIHLEENLN